MYTGICGFHNAQWAIHIKAKQINCKTTENQLYDKPTLATIQNETNSSTFSQSVTENHVLPFWWNNWRKLHLRDRYPHTFQRRHLLVIINRSDSVYFTSLIFFLLIFFFVVVVCSFVRPRPSCLLVIVLLFFVPEVSVAVVILLHFSGSFISNWQ